MIDQIDSYGRAVYGQYCGSLFLFYARTCIINLFSHASHVGRSFFRFGQIFLTPSLRVCAIGDLYRLSVAFVQANFIFLSPNQANMEGSNSSTGQGRQSSVTSLTDLASASSAGQPPAASAAAAASGGSGSGGATNAGAATATLTITEEATQDVPQEQILRLSLAPRPRVTWCV